MLAQFDDSLIQSLPTIRVPTLVVVGSEDTNFLGAADYRSVTEHLRLADGREIVTRAMLAATGTLSTHGMVLEQAHGDNGPLSEKAPSRRPIHKPMPRTRGREHRRESSKR